MLYNAEVHIVDNFHVDAESMEDAYEKAQHEASLAFDISPHQVAVQFVKEIK